jgi:pimeloyl-ACP methyl ester carboxylesterase
LDFTGHGDSEGSIGPDFINQQVADLGAALDWVATRKEIDSERIGVNGSSTGGNVAILRAATDPRIRVLVLRSPPCEGLYEVARRIAVPTLIVQGELDPVRVQTRRLFEVLTCEKKYTLIKGASHLYETPEALDQMIRATVDWFVDKLSG